MRCFTTRTSPGVMLCRHSHSLVAQSASNDLTTRPFVALSCIARLAMAALTTIDEEERRILGKAALFSPTEEVCGVSASTTLERLAKLSGCG